MAYDGKSLFSCLIIAMILLLHGTAIAQIDKIEEARRIAEYFAEPEILKLPGNYFNAVMVAYKDFYNKINHEKSPGRFGSKVEDYMITITRRDEGLLYKVRFQRKPFKGELIKGGGAIYIIDGKTFKLIEKEYTM
jgi:hypothetical protein